MSSRSTINGSRPETNTAAHRALALKAQPIGDLVNVFPLFIANKKCGNKKNDNQTENDFF